MNAAVTKMNTSELYEYASQTIAHAQEHGATTVTKSPLFVGLSTLFTKYDDGFKKDGKSMLTNPIVTLDIDRDRLVKWCYYTTLALTFSSDSSMVEAATHLLSKLETYGGLSLTKFAHGEESAAIKSMLNDFRRPEYASDVTKTTIKPILDELATVQAEFDQKFQERREEKDERINVDAAYTLRGELEVAIRKFRLQVSGNALADPSSEWSKVDSVLQQLDAEYTQKLRTKSTLRAKQKEKK